MDSSTADVQDTLVKRHRAAATTVLSMLVGVILLSLVAYFVRDRFTFREDKSIDLAFRVVVLVLGLGSIYWRRRSLTAPRLEAVAATEGKLGLINYLEKATLKVAVLGDAIAVVGFITTALTGNELYTYWAAVIAIVVLILHYPRKSVWQKTLEAFPAGSKQFLP